jgi:hypothetical protein
VTWPASQANRRRSPPRLRPGSRTKGTAGGFDRRAGLLLPGEIDQGDGPLSAAERATVAEVASLFGSFLGQHIQMEDGTLFPMAMQVLPQEFPTAAPAERISSTVPGRAASSRQGSWTGARAAMTTSASSLFSPGVPLAGEAPLDPGPAGIEADLAPRVGGRPHQLVADHLGRIQQSVLSSHAGPHPGSARCAASRPRPPGRGRYRGAGCRRPCAGSPQVVAEVIAPGRLDSRANYLAHGPRSSLLPWRFGGRRPPAPVAIDATAAGSVAAMEARPGSRRPPAGETGGRGSSRVRFTAPPDRSGVATVRGSRLGSR